MQDKTRVNRYGTVSTRDLLNLQLNVIATYIIEIFFSNLLAQKNVSQLTEGAKRHHDRQATEQQNEYQAP